MWAKKFWWILTFFIITFTFGQTLYNSPCELFAAQINHLWSVLIDHFPFLYNSLDTKLIFDPWSINVTIGSSEFPNFTKNFVLTLIQWFLAKWLSQKLEPSYPLSTNFTRDTSPNGILPLPSPSLFFMNLAPCEFGKPISGGVWHFLLIINKYYMFYFVNSHNLQRNISILELPDNDISLR